jgi:heme exporter protein A
LTTPASSPAPLPAIEAVDICRRYGRRWALANVSFSAAQGRVLMVSGRNGSGKSTLLRVLATAIRADRGSARVLGLDVAQDRDEARRHLSLLSHYGYHYEALTALDNLRIAARFLAADASRERLLGRLAELGLAERADDAVVTYSAGMRKRLALARTLLQDVPVVMLDEPYAALDPPGCRLVDRLIDRLRDERRSVLIATHQLDHGSALCDDGIVLEAGRLVWSGPAASLPSQSGLEPEPSPVLP